MRNSLSFFFSSFHLQGGSLMAISWGHWHYRSVHWSCLCFLFPLSPSLHPSIPSSSLSCPPFFLPLLCLLILCATIAESPCLAITLPLTHLGFFYSYSKIFHLYSASDSSSSSLLSACTWWVLVSVSSFLTVVITFSIITSKIVPSSSSCLQNTTSVLLPSSFPSQQALQVHFPLFFVHQYRQQESGTAVLHKCYLCLLVLLGCNRGLF